MVEQHDIDLARRLADVAGDIIRPLFRSAALRVEGKPDASPVTQADRDAEAAMRAIVEAERPADGFIGEEHGGVREGTSRVWVVDPIDGTRAFIAGRATFGTLIALMEDGVPVLGVIDQPVAGDRWVGVNGTTTLNRTPVRTRACGGLGEARLATTGPWHFTPAQSAGFNRVAHVAADVLWGGDCTSYALLASGWLDGVIEAGLKLHDWAALVPVVEGAGGVMRDWTGVPLRAGSDGRVVALGDPELLPAVLARL